MSDTDTVIDPLTILLSRLSRGVLLPEERDQLRAMVGELKRERDQHATAIDRVRTWADGPCPTRPAGFEITGDRAGGYVQAMDEIGQLLTGCGPIAALYQQPTTEATR